VLRRTSVVRDVLATKGQVSSWDVSPARKGRKGDASDRTAELLRIAANGPKLPLRESTGVADWRPNSDVAPQGPHLWCASFLERCGKARSYSPMRDCLRRMASMSPVAARVRKSSSYNSARADHATATAIYEADELGLQRPHGDRRARPVGRWVGDDHRARNGTGRAARHGAFGADERPGALVNWGVFRWRASWIKPSRQALQRRSGAPLAAIGQSVCFGSVQLERP
jgi:hypothetical protein